MSNDVLISIPLFVFMGYLVERANLIEKLFKSLHLALARIPGSLAVATLVTCAIFATATGIVGAVVTLMGLLAFPAMLRAGYNVKISAGVITAGGCLGILIPPSVMLIVYGATAGVSVVQLYAGAFFPGIMLALLYIVYVIILAKLRPAADAAAAGERAPRRLACLRSRDLARPAHAARCRAARRPQGPRNAACRPARCCASSLVTLLPAIVFAVLMGLTWHALTKPDVVTTRRRWSDGRAVARRTDDSGGRSRRAAERRRTAGAAERGRAAGASARGRRARSRRRTAPPQEPPATAPPTAVARRRDASGTSRPREGAAPTWERLPAPTGVLDRRSASASQRWRLLRDVHVRAARGVQDAAGVVLPARAADPRGARHDRVRAWRRRPRRRPWARSAASCWRRSTRCSTQPPEKRRRIWKTWIPLWILVLSSIVWFFLLKFEVLESGPPLWVGWVSIVATAVWCVLAVFQVKLVPHRSTSRCS